MTADSECYHIPGLGEFPNLETATTAAEIAAAKGDNAVEIFRVLRTRVRSVEREVTIRVTDMEAEAVASLSEARKA